MKWIWILMCTAMLAAGAQAKERLPFPFDQATRITFIRLGNVNIDAGQQFALHNKEGQWVIERRISRYHATSEDITDERANEIITAFSSLYTYWQQAPYRDTRKNGYSLYISINDTWQTTLRVKDRGSPDLNTLIELIEYPEGLTLEKVKEEELPSEIRLSTTNQVTEGSSESPSE